MFIEFLQENVLLLAIIFVCIVMLVFPNGGRKKELIDNDELIEFINKKQAQVVDIRDAQEFKAGHIASSVNIPYKNFSKELGSLNKDKPTIVVDQASKNSSRASTLLRRAGFKNVYVLEKGIKGWTEARLPFKR